MAGHSTFELLSRLTPGVRDILAAKLRAAGELADGAPLESAFEEPTRDVMDCVVGCHDAFEAEIEKCQTDDCRAGAAFRMRQCIRNCKEEHGLRAASNTSLGKIWDELNPERRAAVTALLPKFGMRIGTAGLPERDPEADDSYPPEPPDEPDPNATPAERCARACMRAHRRRLQACAEDRGDDDCYKAAAIALQACLEGCRSREG